MLGVFVSCAVQAVVDAGFDVVAIETCYLFGGCSWYARMFYFCELCEDVLYHNENPPSFFPVQACTTVGTTCTKIDQSRATIFGVLEDKVNALAELFRTQG
mmetsp:Transcript_55091/g.81752  ORF Transcript_55091/g.81752 Transcript_55091/m.81752 type:complete len:101 (+) Transcript_55091:1176-1478(+)